MLEPASAPLQKSDLLSADSVAREIEEELIFHVRSLAEENVARGMSADDAWANAQRRFGSVQEYTKQTWRIDMANYLTLQRMAIGGLAVLALLCGWLWLQVQELHGQNRQILQLVQNKSAPDNSAPLKSYPIKLSADDVREFSKFAVDFGKLQLHADAASVVPISCEPGVTGLVVIGDGTFKYAPEAEKVFQGHFRSVLLRFNPKDLDSILKLESGKKVTEKDTYEMARVVIQGAFRRSWHRGMEALIPTEGSFSADVDSKENGDILISQGDNRTVVFSFTDKKPLYEKK